MHVAASALGNEEARSEVVKCLIWLIDEIKVDIEARDHEGWNVLHVAANSCDDPASLLVLLARGADPLMKTLHSSELPSDYAHFQRHLKARAVLLEAESAVDSVQSNSFR